MIGRIHGVIEEIQENVLLIKINSGISYLVHCFFAEELKENDEISLYIDAQFKEDGYHLCGFRSLQEKATFKYLLSVQGVGNKVALGILNSFSLSNIYISVMNKNDALFQSVPGIGSKLANRIVTELNTNRSFLEFYKDKIYNLSSYKSEDEQIIPHQIENDVISALTNLGMAKNVIIKIIHKAKAKYSDDKKNSGEKIDFNNFLKLCLSISSEL